MTLSCLWSRLEVQVSDLEHDTPHDGVGFFDRPDVRSTIFRGTVVAYFVFVLAGFLPYEKHPHFDFEVLPFFQGFYGLFCCIGLVLAAAWMRTFLMRSEDYYDDE